MRNKNSVFIATSLDGFIADRQGGLEWLHSIPNPDNLDMGYHAFMENIDALVMGRTTFETVCGFDIDWPYSKPVFVLSTKLKTIPDEYNDKAFLIKGSLNEILQQLHGRGFLRLYIDGGVTIQSFLHEDLIDEMVITTIPVLLGGGSTLFAELPSELSFELIRSEVYLDMVVQSHYKRRNKKMTKKIIMYESVII